MKTILLALLIFFIACKKEEPEVAPVPPPVVTPPPTPPPPLPDKIFSVRIYGNLTQPWMDSFSLDYFETYNLTTSGTPASAIDQYWLAENDTIGVSGKFKPAFPYDTIYTYVRRWDSLTDTVPVEFKDTVIVTLLEFNYTYIYQ